MWKKFVKDYLSFTKKDRVGVIVLVSLIFLMVLLPYIWPAKKAIQPDKLEIEKIRLQLNKTDDTISSAPLSKQYRSAPYAYTTKKDAGKTNVSLFYFDPNTLSAAGWQRLGIREKTAATIVRYVSKGGRFLHPQDIGKIYGLHTDDYERLLPYVKIESRPAAEKKSSADKKNGVANNKPAYAPKHFYASKVVEINSADTTAFIALPGIGSRLAARIINFREKLGGFYSVQQVGETYALPDSTFSKIQGLLQCNSALVKQLNINTADANMLKQHPYIRWNLANAIVQYRVQHGNFKSADDLQQIAMVTPEMFQKIRPYITVQ